MVAQGKSDLFCGVLRFYQEALSLSNILASFKNRIILGPVFGNRSKYGNKLTTAVSAAKTEIGTPILATKIASTTMHFDK